MKNLRAAQISQTVKAIKAIVTEIFISRVISCRVWIIPGAGQTPPGQASRAAGAWAKTEGARVKVKMQNAKAQLKRKK